MALLNLSLHCHLLKNLLFLLLATISSVRAMSDRRSSTDNADGNRSVFRSVSANDHEYSFAQEVASSSSEPQLDTTEAPEVKSNLHHWFETSGRENLEHLFRVRVYTTSPMSQDS